MSDSTSTEVAAMNLVLRLEYQASNIKPRKSRWFEILQSQEQEEADSKWWVAYRASNPWIICKFSLNPLLVESIATDHHSVADAYPKTSCFAAFFDTLYPSSPSSQASTPSLAASASHASTLSHTYAPTPTYVATPYGPAARALNLWSEIARGSTAATGSTTSEVSQYDANQQNFTKTIGLQDYDSIITGAIARALANNPSSLVAAPVTGMTTQNHFPRQPFRATRMVLERRGIIPPSTLNSGTGYQGDTNSASFSAQIEGLPDDENCALFLSNIPLAVTQTDILARIHVGSVFALHINPPDEAHPFQAAKLVFMDPEAAAAFMKSNIWLRGRRLGVRYNRFGYRRNTEPYSRCLMIEGPPHMMTLQFWDQYFFKYSLLNWDRVLYVECDKPGMEAMEFRFSRIDGQAQTCFQAINADRELKGVVTVRYVRDPCAGF